MLLSTQLLLEEWFNLSASYNNLGMSATDANLYERNQRVLLASMHVGVTPRKSVQYDNDVDIGADFSSLHLDPEGFYTTSSLGSVRYETSCFLAELLED